MARSGSAPVSSSFAGNISLGIVDRVDRHESPVAEIPDRPAAFARAGPQHRLVITEVEAGDLQLYLVLIRPEPGFGIIGDFSACQYMRGGLGLINRVLD